MGWSVLGQERLLAGLERAVARGSVAHAYLLVGPPHVGKGTLALDLAQAMNCAGDTPPCGQCRQCRRIQEEKHADVETLALLTSQESGRWAADIHIDQVLELQRRLALPPYEGRCRVIIVDGAELLNQAAANALLKSLEEPLPGVMFLLLTSAEEAVLPTVRSRCQRLELRPMAIEAVAQALGERYGQAPQQADALARFSQGCLGRAVRAIREPQALAQWQQDIDLLLKLSQATLDERFASAATLAAQFPDDRRRIYELLGRWEGWWRDVLLTKYQLGKAVQHRERQPALEGFAARLSPAEVLSRLEELQATRFALERNANPRLALDVLMLDMTVPSPVATAS